MSTKEIEQIKIKADKWDALDKKIGEFYTDSDGKVCMEGQKPVNTGDLCDIGEIAATEFGWL